MPAINAEHYFSAKWAETMYSFLARLRSTKYDRSEDYFRFCEDANIILFHAVYYKLCLSKQMFNCPVYDAMNYETVYSHFCNNVKSDKGIKIDFPTLEELHDMNGPVKLTDNILETRKIIVCLAKDLTKLGFQLVIPFHVRTVNIAAYNFTNYEFEYTEFTLRTTKFDFENNILFSELFWLSLTDKSGQKIAFQPRSIENLTVGQLF